MLSCAASTNFSWVDNGGSCVFAFTAPKFGTTQNIRLVCSPSISSFLSPGAGALSCGGGVWSALPLSVGGAAAGLLCDVGLCSRFCGRLDSSVTGVRGHDLVVPDTGYGRIQSSAKSP